MAMSMQTYLDVVLERLRVAPFSGAAEAKDGADVFDTSFVAEYNARPSRYLLVRPAIEPAEADRLASGEQIDHDVRFVIRAVGKRPREARFAADFARARLAGARLEAPGRSSRKIRHATSDPPQKDSSVGAGLYFYDDEYAWFSTPA